MEAQYQSFEIVHIIHGYKLIDSESYERHYWRPDGEPLPPGYYVVHWPGGVTVRRFDEDARFYGIFRGRQDAEAALVHWMNLVRPAGASPPGPGRRHDSAALEVV